MKIVIPKGAVIEGEGKEFPYTVISDLGLVGVVVNTAVKDSPPIIIPRESISIETIKTYTYCAAVESAAKKEV